jgi:hypothetical protein
VEVTDLLQEDDDDDRTGRSFVRMAFTRFHSLFLGYGSRSKEFQATAALNPS